jgi:hypothetical protein
MIAVNHRHILWLSFIVIDHHIVDRRQCCHIRWLSFIVIDCRQWSLFIVIDRHIRWSSFIVIDRRQCRQWSSFSFFVVNRQCRWSSSIVDILNTFVVVPWSDIDITDRQIDRRSKQYLFEWIIKRMPIYIQIEMATHIFFSTIHTYTNNSGVLYQTSGDQIVVLTATFHHYQRTGEKSIQEGGSWILFLFLTITPQPKVVNEKEHKRSQISYKCRNKVKFFQKVTHGHCYVS